MTGKVSGINTNIPNYGDIPNNINYTKKVSLKNSTPFFNCTLKINNQLIEDAQDLDIVNPMCNLLNYSKNVRKTTGSFWNYYPDMPISEYVGDNERTRIFHPIRNSESFDYKTKLVGNLPNDDSNAELENIKFVLPLKRLSSFIFNLNFLMISTEIELILKCSQNYVLTERVTREAKPLIPAQGENPQQNAVNAINRPATLKFSTTDCKLCVTVVTLQEKYENKLYTELKTGIDIDFE